MGLHGFICGLVDQWSVFASVCPKLSFCLAAPFLLCLACVSKVTKNKNEEYGEDVKGSMLSVVFFTLVTQLFTYTVPYSHSH